MKRWKFWMVFSIAVICLFLMLLVGWSFRERIIFFVFSSTEKNLTRKTVEEPVFVNREIERETNKALLLIDQGKWQEGETSLIALLKYEMPPVQRFQILCVLGDLYGSRANALGDIDGKKAREAIKRALDLAKKSPGQIPPSRTSHAYELLGMILLGVENKYRDPEEAERFLRQALKIDPSNTQALQNLAFLYRERKKSRKAQKLLEEAIGILNSKIAKTPASDIFVVNGLRQRLIELHKGVAELSIFRKDLFYAKKNLNIALDLLSRLENFSLPLTLLTCEEYSRIGWLFFKIGELDRAELCFRKAIEAGYSESEYDVGLSPHEGLRNIKKQKKSNLNKKRRG